MEAGELLLFIIFITFYDRITGERERERETETERERQRESERERKKAHRIASEEDRGKKRGRG